MKKQLLFATIYLAIISNGVFAQNDSTKATNPITVPDSTVKQNLTAKPDSTVKPNLAKTSDGIILPPGETYYYANIRAGKKKHKNIGRSMDDGYFTQVVQYSLDTLFDKPHGNTIMVMAGFQGDADANGAGSGYYGVYGRARYNIGRFLQVSGMYANSVTTPATQPDFKYSILEASGAFFFSDKMEKDNRAFKVKGKIKEIKTVFHSDRRVNSQNSAATMLAVPKAVQIGVCGGFFNWTRPLIRGPKDTLAFKATNELTGSHNYQSNVYTNVHVTGFSAGFAMTTNAKAKYKFHSYNTERYHEGQTRSGEKVIKDNGFKNGLRDMSVDLALELLVGGVTIQNTSTLVQNGKNVNYLITDAKTKNVGYRVRAELRSKIFSLRMEIGCRPGASYGVGGSKTSSILNGAYYLLGVGFGIGAL